MLWGAVALVVLAAAGGAGYRYLAPVAESGSGEALVGGPFELVDGDGRPTTDMDFHGKPFAVFFGFTHCPDVCPTSLYEMTGWIEALGADADRMRFAFVSVDPERDTPDVLGGYVRSFSDRIIALTGSTEQVAAILDAYRVYARRVPLDGGDYTMDHSAFVYLMDANGRYQAHITYGETPDRAVAKLRTLIDATS